MECKLCLNKALKIQPQPKAINKGSGGLSGQETLVMARDMVITEGFQEEAAFETHLQEWENLDPGGDGRQG